MEFKRIGKIKECLGIGNYFLQNWSGFIKQELERTGFRLVDNSRYKEINPNSIPAKSINEEAQSELCAVYMLEERVLIAFTLNKSRHNEMESQYFHRATLVQRGGKPMFFSHIQTSHFPDKGVGYNWEKFKEWAKQDVFEYRRNLPFKEEL